MKKIILFALLTSSLFAESTVYIGTGYANYTETLSLADTSISENSASFKVGYGDRKAYAIEFSVDYIDNASRNATLDYKAKYGFNVSLLKSFDWDIYVYPYLKAGFGAGKRDASDKKDVKSLAFGSFNLGTGVFIPVSEDFDVELGYEYRNLSYANEEGTSLDNPDYERSHVNMAYLGVNFRF